MSRKDSKKNYFPYESVQNEIGYIHLKALANKQERTFTKKQVMSDLK